MEQLREVHGSAGRTWVRPWWLVFLGLLAVPFFLFALSGGSQEITGATGHLQRLQVLQPAGLAEVEALCEAVPLKGVAALLAQQIQARAQGVSRAVLRVTQTPDVVLYTVSRGGSLRDVANSFGLPYGVILGLNPGRDLEGPLLAGESVVVYRRDPEVVGASLGSTGRGSLRGGMPMLEGPGRVLRGNRFKSWATPATVGRLDWVLRQWHDRFPGAHPILVGNLSLRLGGKVTPHRTHQSGRDVDLGYPMRLAEGEGPSWQRMHRGNLDCERSWDLLLLLEESGGLDVAYVDYELQKLLHGCAAARGLTGEALRRWLQYPDGPSAGQRLLRHAPGHVDHIHVRFRCEESDVDCVE